MNIEKISIGKLPNEEHFELMDIIRIIFGVIIPATWITGLWDKFLQLFNELDTALEQPVRSPYSDEIRNADEQRDNTFRSLRTTIKTFLNHSNADKKQAAKVLMTVFDKYGDVSRLNYDRETAAIYNLVEDLKGKYTAEVTLLGLEQWVQDLEDQNLTCKDLMKDRNLQQSEKPVIKVPEARKAIDACYADLVKSLEAYMINNPEHGFEPQITELNTAITRFKTRMAQKEGRAKAAKERQEQSTEDTELDTLINTEKVAVIEQNEQIANQPNQHHQPHWTPIPPRDNDKPFEK